MSSLSLEQRQEIIKKYQRNEGDTGSPEVQVALLSARIKKLSSDHFSSHKKDYASLRGLSRMNTTRRSLLRYLNRKSPERYLSLIDSLGIRDYLGVRKK